MSLSDNHNIFVFGSNLAGQLSVRWVENRINQFMNKMLKTTDVNYVIAVDTDSCYINLDSFVKQVFGDAIDDKMKVINLIDNFCEKTISPFINKCYDELGTYVNAFEQAMYMKREVIADKGIWTGKKHYILNVYNSEGVAYAEPQLKIVGIESVRSSTPETCRIYIKEALKVIMNKTEVDLIKFIEEYKLKFMQMDFEEVAFPRGINNLLKFSDRNTIFGKGAPMQVRGALIYNHMLKDKNLQNKYPEIYEGEKAKFAYLKKPNPTHDYVITCPGELPKEFGLHKYLDHETQFEKAFIVPLRSILDVIGWHTEEQGSTLEDMFG